MVLVAPKDSKEPRPWRGALASRGRPAPEFVECLRRDAARLGAIHHHVLTPWIRSVQPAPVQIKLADERMTVMMDTQAVTHIRAWP